MTDNFKFVRPCEAPTFTPTEEEWKDPLTYINKIRPQAEKAGICKIKPPTTWQPPFAVDVDSFKFTPRVQRLNELEAKTRIKLNFLDQIAKFWELQGSSLKIPVIEKKALDLYSLHKLVQIDGGKDKVNNDKKWNRLAARLGLNPDKNYGLLIRQHYEKILYPFEVFTKAKVQLSTPSGDVETTKKGSPMKGSPTKGSQMKNSPMKNSPMKNSPVKNSPTKNGGRMGGKNNNKVSPLPDPIEDTEKQRNGLMEMRSKELKRLMFYGAGPKMAGYVKPVVVEPKVRGRKSHLSVHDPLAKYMCLECKGGAAEEMMLLCDGCDDSYHTFCLKPPLEEVPKGDWRCPKCVAEDLNKPGEAFGFEQATRQYTLHQFGEMADQFKAEYFNMPVHLVPLNTVEKEFWRIVSAIDEDVTVEYGADLHTMDHGSGFPTGLSKHISTSDEDYVKSGWNLNNLPNLPGSVLGHINADISGMKVPWMYVGMCFSTFCWHNEDHWSYSINYLHWGEPKTWYGVPGDRANDFEDAMKKAAPELFQSQPDLLHQLVTIMNPNILMNAGVPVYRMDQRAGEFIITFPRAYHAGFNQGYNFAEAVNFAPADWLSIGRECIQHYSTLHRYCVFSHDELVCSMAASPHKLNACLGLATYEDYRRMIKQEFDDRTSVKDWGAKEGEHVDFETLADDERICDFCKTTCFLSCVTCPCTKDRLVCLKHHRKLCDCPGSRHQYKIRYTKDKLISMATELYKRTENFLSWIDKMTVGLNSMDEDDRLELEELTQLVEEAEKNEYPGGALLEKGRLTVNEAEKVRQVAQYLVGQAHKTRKTNTDETLKARFNLKEVVLLANDMKILPVRLAETARVESLSLYVLKLQEKVDKILASKLEQNIEEIQECIKGISDSGVDMPNQSKLDALLKKLKWQERAEVVMSEKRPGVFTKDYLMKIITEGEEFRSEPDVVSPLVELKRLQDAAKEYEREAKTYLSTRTKSQFNQIKDLLKKVEKFQVALTSTPELRNLISSAAEWSNRVNKINDRDEGNWPYLDELEWIVRTGNDIPIHFTELKVLSCQVEAAKAWKIRLSRCFLKKNTTLSLMEVLVPRLSIPSIPSRGRKNDKSSRSSIHLEQDQYAALINLDKKKLKVATKFKETLEDNASTEFHSMLNLRAVNREKWKNDTGSSLYCVCQSQASAFMIRCELCYEWFHVTCVPLPRTELSESDGNKKMDISSQAVTAHKISTKEIRYIGPCCARSKKPRYEEVLPLLKSLSKLPVRMIESEALRHLLDRYVVWQDSIVSFLATPDISEAIESMKKMDERNALMKSVIVDVGVDSKVGILGNDIKSELGVEPRTSSTIIVDRSESPVIKMEIEDQPDVVDEVIEFGNGIVAEALKSTETITVKSENSQKAAAAGESPSLIPEVMEEKISAAEKETRRRSSLSVPTLKLSVMWLKVLEKLLVDIDLLELAGGEKVELMWRLLEFSRESPINSLSVKEIQDIIAQELKKKDIKTKAPKTPKNVTASPRKRRTSGRKTVGQGPQPVKRTKSVDSTASGAAPKKRQKKTALQESEEDCSARPCKKPEGKEVNWVQCEGKCELWFHYNCVGLNKKLVQKLERYECGWCNTDDLKNDGEGTSSDDTEFKSVCSNKENSELMSLSVNDDRFSAEEVSVDAIVEMKAEPIGGDRRKSSTTSNSTEDQNPPLSTIHAQNNSNTNNTNNAPPTTTTSSTGITLAQSNSGIVSPPSLKN